MFRSVLGRMAMFVIPLMAVSGSVAGDATLFDQLLSDYEAIRSALLHDSMGGVQESAIAMAQHLNEYDPEADVPAAAVKRENLVSFANTIRNVGAFAEHLSREETLAGARDAFGDLSRAIVAYRQMMESPKGVVVFCSMAEKVWLQRNEQIGNPYYGQSMAGCGEIISE